MFIQKRWIWITSVTLLGLLARADGRNDNSSLSDNVEESSLMYKVDKHSSHDLVLKTTTEDHTKHGDTDEEYVFVEAELVTPVNNAGHGNLENMGIEMELPELVNFPYTIDSPPSVVFMSAMLSYCAYDESRSMDECKEFWEQSCDKDAFHQFQLDGLNAVTVCKNEDRVYVAFAGTQSMNDGIVDASILSRAKNFSKRDLYAHGGFTSRAKEYSAWVKEKLSSIPGINRRELVFTGHSLGSASATLLAHDMYEGLELNIHGGVSNSLNQVKVFGFGSPSALLDPNSYFLGHLNHVRFYNPYDPVATVLSRWSGYGHVGVQIAIPDRPARHLARAAGLLSRHKTLKLLRQLPLSYWSSLPPLPRSRFDLGFDAHVMDSYAILADKVFEDFQKQRHIHQSDTSLVNVEKVLSKRLGTTVTCYLQNDKVVCLSGNNVVAKFRYAMNPLPAGHKTDACMTSLVKNNLVPGVTVNAGISIDKDISAVVAASEALVLDISEEDRWYEQLSTKTLNALYLDGRSSLPMTCERKPTFLDSEKTFPTERALIRNSINAPKLFTIAKDHSIIANKTIVSIHNDVEFFGDVQQDGWMDCSRTENSAFCPASCKDNQACAVMKNWGADDNGINYWVSLSKDSNLTWNDGDSWKYTITEKKNSWLSHWRSQSQATFTVIKS